MIEDHSVDESENATSIGESIRQRIT